jgi:hypothetical protein
LPRIEFNGLSNLAGGYVGVDLMVGGLRPEQWVYLAEPGFWYAGLTVLALAMAAPVIARGRLGGQIWYFGIAFLVALVLTDTFETPLDFLLYHLLPGFATLHPHAPERILTVAYLGPALLAGAVASVMPDIRWLRGTAGLAALVVIMLVALDLAVGGAKARADRGLTNPLDGIEALSAVDLTAYYVPDGAASFLHPSVGQDPFRYIGYAPTVDGQPVAYTVRYLDPSTFALEVNNRALGWGLQDAQGYDASHLRRYDMYLNALNGQAQNYHNADVLRDGLSSPLLDLLNVRYIVVPSAGRLEPMDAVPVGRFSLPVYMDKQVTILENRSAFPRAWIVHSAQQVGPQDALRLIGSGQVDARTIALLEDGAPPLSVPAQPALDRASVLRDDADRLTIRTSTDAPGLVVLSEIYYPAWHAYLDGQPVHTYTADGALRAVAVPPGEHTVELRYESIALTIGIAISGVAILGLAALWLVNCLFDEGPHYCPADS